MTGDDVEAEIQELLESSGRERKRRLKEIVPKLRPEHVRLVAPLVRDPSPRISSRIVSVLARHGDDELFAAQLSGLKPGKIALLRAQYARLRR